MNRNIEHPEPELPEDGAGAPKGSLRRPFIFLAAFAGYLAVGYLYATRLHFISLEGLVRCGIVGDLLLGNDLGRQGLVCSLLYAPLPTLLIAAVGALPAFLKHCFAAVVVSAFFGGAAVALFDLVCEPLLKSRLARGLLALAFFSLPPILVHAAGGTSLTMLLACALGLLYLGLQWSRTAELKYFLGYSVLSGVVPMVNWRGVPLAILAAAAMLLIIRRRGRDAAERRGLLWAFAFPPLYAMAAWIGLNWVIMEDPFFAFRVLWRGDGWWREAILLAANPLALLKGGQGALWLALGGFLLAAYGWRLARQRMIRGRAAVVALAAVALIGTWALPFAAALRPNPEPRSGGSNPLLVAWLPPRSLSAEAPIQELRSQIDEVAPAGKLIADGFYGYPMWYYGVGKGRLIRTLDFSSQVLRGVRGPFFVLVPKPTGAAVAEDIHVKFPGIQQGAAPFIGYYFFHVADLGSWQLYKLVD